MAYKEWLVESGEETGPKRMQDHLRKEEEEVKKNFKVYGRCEM